MEQAYEYLLKKSNIDYVNFVRENEWKINLLVNDNEDLIGIIYHLGHLYKVKELYIMMNRTINVFDFLKCQITDV